MPDRWVLDTNIYIGALRDRLRLADLKRFRVRARDRIRMSSVVALELRAGAITPAHAAAVDDLVRPYAERDRAVTPSFDAWLEAGRVLSSLAIAERLRVADAPRSFVNDVVLAASCRESDLVLVTDNARDFTAIQRHLKGFRFRDAFPE
jgi:predicted nucleic acid-binding protein